MNEQTRERDEYRGLHFTQETPEQVRDILVNHLGRESGRLRIIYGNVETGEAWITEEDAKTYGVRSSGEECYIGRSTGSVKIPLAISTRRSSGGGGILDHCIVRIERSTLPHTCLYSHPAFHYKPA